MIFVAVASVIFFFVWLFRAAVLPDRIRFVRNHLQFEHQRSGQDEVNTTATLREQKLDEEIRKFTAKYLKQDGAFLLRLIAHNTDNVTTAEVARALWKFWKNSLTCVLKVASDDGDDDEEPVKQKVPITSNAAWGGTSNEDEKELMGKDV